MNTIIAQVRARLKAIDSCRAQLRGDSPDLMAIYIQALEIMGYQHAAEVAAEDEAECKPGAFSSLIEDALDYAIQETVIAACQTARRSCLAPEELIELADELLPYSTDDARLMVLDLYKSAAWMMVQDALIEVLGYPDVPLRLSLTSTWRVGWHKVRLADYEQEEYYRPATIDIAIGADYPTATHALLVPCTYDQILDFCEEVQAAVQELQAEVDAATELQDADEDEEEQPA